MGDVVANVTFRGRLAAAIGAGSLLTMLLLLVPALEPGTRNPALHVAVETAATVIAILAALLMYGRFGRSLLRRDLILSAALAVFAIANLALSAVPALLTGTPPAATIWAEVVARGFGAALTAVAAFMPTHELRHPGAAARRWLAASALVVAAVAVAALLAGDHLPAAVRPGTQPGDAFAAHPAIATLDAAIMLLFGAAALGFARRADGGRDGLIAWFAVAAVLAAFARLNYLVYPSLLTDWFAAGDVLRLASFLCMLAGGAAEMRLAQRALASAAVQDERRRIARDLHDGTAQDLAFILQIGGRLAARERAPAELDQITAAARHALDNTRNVVTDLYRPSDEPLTSALARTAQDIAAREGVHMEVSGAVDVRVPPTTQEALCHLVREAVTNAIRHGGAGTVRVTVHDTPELQVRVGDDGRGFDPVAARDAHGRYGLRGMAQRVAQLGGELRIASEPGQGTEVLVLLP